ncbi:hypothetical protein C1645_842264 [Glomus cerebriforme]|uniref:Uncharacterized protein n=1 Tax=Glomus cerebriforme TaxID=658196 RepID=A0A397S273_9GLOM|nr:hypothetical protein C1645_842264 [Glomus cerebriforme]
MIYDKFSEGTYVTNVIVPLLRATLEDLPNGCICLSTAERQSLASKARKNSRTNKERMGKKPDVMVFNQYAEKTFELVYVESSRIVSCATKKTNDNVKLWRETLDGASFVNIACRLTSNQFGIIGIQRVKALARLLITLRNVLIVNKSLLARALEQAVTNPPRNVHSSPIVSTPPYSLN